MKTYQLNKTNKIYTESKSAIRINLHYQTNSLILLKADKIIFLLLKFSIQNKSIINIQSKITEYRYATLLSKYNFKYNTSCQYIYMLIFYM